MRTALCMAIGIAAASSAPVHAEEPQALQKLKSERGVSVAVPIGRVRVGPGSADGAPVYVRRTKVSGGMTIVEVSTTPFMPVLPSNAPGVGQSIGRSDQPASW